VWPTAVVEVEERRQQRDPVRRVDKRPRIRPLAEQGPHHPLGLAVGLRPVGAGEAVPDAELVARDGKRVAPVAAAVVGQDPLDRDPVRGVERPGAVQERGRGGRRLVGQLLGVGEPRVVVDRHVHPVPADAPKPVLEAGLVAVDAVTAARADPPQLLGVEVHELARALALVAHDRRPGLQAVKPVERRPAQPGVDRRAGKLRLPCQHVGSGTQLPPAGTDRRDHLGRVGMRLAVHGAAAVGEPGLALSPEPPPPLGCALAAQAGGRGGPRDRPPGLDPLDEQLPAARVQAGISMGHEGPFFDCGFDTSSRTIGALSPSTT